MSSVEAVELLRQLIRNACVNDGTPGSGHEHRSVDTLAGFLGRGGTVVEPEPGRQSVVYRVKGRDPQAPTLLLMGHTDVVPVSEDGWSVDPFAAEVRDGMVWGRGAVDMLNLTAAMAAVFRRYLVGEQPPLPGDLVFLAVADEEAAGGLGARYLTEQRWELVAADYVLTEIGFPALVTPSGPLYPVAVGEKGPFWSRLTSRGDPGHGSVPYGRDNAMRHLVEGLHGLFQTPSPVVISDLWRDFVAELGLEPELAEALVDPDRVDDAIDRLAVTSPRFAAYVHACTHLTVSPTVMTSGVKANVIPDWAEAQVDVRALPGQDREDVDGHLRKAMGAAADRIQIDPIADFPPNSSAVGNPLWEAVSGAVEDLTGSRRVVPTLMTATTDGRFFRQRGAVVYGAGLYDEATDFAEFLAMFHGHDERVSVASVERTTEFLARAVERFGEQIAQ